MSSLKTLRNRKLSLSKEILKTLSFRELPVVAGQGANSAALDTCVVSQPDCASGGETCVTFPPASCDGYASCYTTCP